MVDRESQLYCCNISLDTQAPAPAHGFEVKIAVTKDRNMESKILEIRMKLRPLAAKDIGAISYMLATEAMIANYQEYEDDYNE